MGRWTDDLAPPLTRFSGLCSSCVVEAQRVMRDLNMHPTTTASIFCATDLLSPVVKLFPKPALSGSQQGRRERPRITQGGWFKSADGGVRVRGVGGRTLLTADQLEIKTLSPYNREGGGVRAKEKGSIKQMGEKQTEKNSGSGGLRKTCKGLRPALKTFSTGLILLVQIQQCDKVLKPDLKKV